MYITVLSVYFCFTPDSSFFKGSLLTLLQVIRHFDGSKADLVVCDGAPDGK
jgi:hypothetical protein